MSPVKLSSVPVSFFFKSTEGWLTAFGVGAMCRACVVVVTSRAVTRTRSCSQDLGFMIRKTLIYDPSVHGLAVRTYPKIPSLVLDALWVGLKVLTRTHHTRFTFLGLGLGFVCGLGCK